MITTKELKKSLWIDIGSSTIKSYLLTENGLKLLNQKSYSFKKELDTELGLSELAKTEIVNFINKAKLKDIKVNTFATALYRKMTLPIRLRLVDEVFEKTGVYFNVIEHDLESFYLQMALVGKMKTEEPVLLINIGGGSTEMVVMQNKKVVEQENIEVGVGTIMGEFPDVNEDNSKTSLTQIKQFIDSRLPNLSSQVKLAFYSGGELKFMQVAKYPLKKNHILNDTDHPSTIDVSSFAKMNTKLFSETKVSQLEELMPENPTWMHGARSCSALAEAICEKYAIEVLIPSNSNLIDGAVRQEFRSATISGSFRKHIDYILDVKARLERAGITVLSPRFAAPKNPGEEFVIFSGEEGQSPLNLERYHLDSISKSDVLIVCDPGGYVGASAMIEIGYANALGKRIVFTETPSEFMLQTLPSQVGL